uniref:Uncharacterized protein n=1 Tax=Nelumbo nucifera TaxID=4432 RepID=A0A822ZPP9_NELNU|nr:TPA_asm: hypothetical protein HUJ06_016397 [Nelumbo nucifera]
MEREHMEMERMEAREDIGTLETCIQMLNDVFRVHVLSPACFVKATKLFQEDHWTRTFIAMDPNLRATWLNALADDESREMSCFD